MRLSTKGSSLCRKDTNEMASHSYNLGRNCTSTYERGAAKKKKQPVKSIMAVSPSRPKTLELRKKAFVADGIKFLVAQLPKSD